MGRGNQSTELTRKELYVNSNCQFHVVATGNYLVCGKRC
jgi:hypothetical protein